MNIERLTAEQFLQRHGHMLMLALRLAKCTSQRDLDNDKSPSFVRRVAREDLATWDALHAAVDRFYV
jgi:hypothetical protein